jgi:hypothetical protein
MGKLLQEPALNAKTLGLNFGAWRHTVKSIGEDTGLANFLKRIQGHAVGKIDEAYFKPTADQLRAVTDHLRRVLLPPSFTATVAVQVAA